MRFTKKIPVVAAAFAATLTMAACGQGESSPAASAGEVEGCETTHALNVAIAPGRAGGELELAKRTGILDDHCLVLSIQQVASPAASLASLTGGSTDLTFTPMNVLVNAVAKGLPVRVVAQDLGVRPDAKDVPESEITTSSVYVGPDSSISKPSDLEGKTVSVAARHDSSELRLAAAIAADGGDPGKVDWVQLDHATAVEQMLSGAVEAAALVSPFSNEAIDAGATVPFPTMTALYEPGTAYTAWTTSQSVVDSKAEAVKAFRAAVNETQAYAMENTEDFDLAMSDYSKVPLEKLKSEPAVYFPKEVTQKDLENVAGKLLDLGYLDSKPDLSGVIVGG